MTNNNIIPKNDFINSSAKAKLSIKLNMHGGVLRGNIIDNPEDLIPTPPIIITCIEDGLDFSCPENSGYISVI